jgi:hypothetical protein
MRMLRVSMSMWRRRGGWGDGRGFGRLLLLLERKLEILQKVLRTKSRMHLSNSSVVTDRIKIVLGVVARILVPMQGATCLEK